MHWFIYRVNWMALFGCRELINMKAWNGCQGCLVEYGYGTITSRLTPC